MIGIYKIVNIKDKKVYIGSSKRIEIREKEHFKKLKNNKHHSIKLQRAYNKYGIKNFILEIVEIVEDESKLFERENYYIELYNSFNEGYNCCQLSEGIYKTNKREQENKKKAENYRCCQKFIDIYEKYKDNIIYSKTFLGRLLDFHYKSYEYKKQIEIIEWFLKNYSLEDFKVEISYYCHSVPYINIIEIKYNLKCDVFYYKGKEFQQHPHDVKAVKNYRKHLLEQMGIIVE